MANSPRRWKLIGAIGALALLSTSNAFGQGPATSAATRAARFGGAHGMDNPALRYFGGPVTQRPTPQRGAATVSASPVARAPVHKPFHGATLNSPVTPYLSLDLLESSTGLPNYYAFVRPQLEQRRQFEIQQAQYLKLQQQVNAGAATNGGPTGQAGGAPSRYSARFQNYGAYYPLR